VKVLLDTHTFLWWNMGDPILSARVRAIIAGGQNEIYLSAASAWEITIKAAKGRLILPVSVVEYIPSRMRLYRFQPLPVQISHAAHGFELPPLHSDPFDRLLIAQSQLESIPLVTRDEDIQRYDLETIW
jgi:PIN domain nuclease of toxin-antitoxin system